MPAAGNRWGAELRGVGIGVHYWSSSLSGDPYMVWLFYSTPSMRCVDDNYRNNGRSVRPVRSSR
ncbi:MAG: hypothetical protein IKT08_07200 [Bacteroidales bacterium]|nr:hypothetical protein [Bacteroidales bacterium]